MQLWRIDIVGGVMLVDPRTGELREAKVVTGVDDHSRYCVMAAVVERATGRAVCLAFAAALARFGVPEEVLTDNGKQFTDRFGKGGEVLFDRICRDNGITHRLTAPASPNQNGKVERFHGTLRPRAARRRGAVHVPGAGAGRGRCAGCASTTPTGRIRRWTTGAGQPGRAVQPDRQGERELLPLWLPPALAPAPAPARPDADVDGELEPSPSRRRRRRRRHRGGAGRAAVEFDRVVPPSGNMAGRSGSSGSGPARAGMTVRFWADCDVIHLLIAGARVKTLRSHLSVNDLARLAAAGAVPAGRSRCRA